jgi:glucose/arabinose dehydrogenase
MAGISASAAQAAGIEPIASGVTWVASQSNEVTGYNNATGAVTGQFSYTSSNQLTDPHAVAVTPDGTTALVTSTSGNVNVITGASSSSPSMTNAQSVTTCPTQATCAPYTAAIGPYGGLITDDVNSSGSGWVIPVSVNETTGTATFQNALQV